MHAGNDVPATHAPARYAALPRVWHATVSAPARSRRVPAALALAGYLAALVLIVGAASPAMLRLLHRAGFTGATLEEVTLRLLEIVAIVLIVPLLAVLGGGGVRAWGIASQDRWWLRAGRGALIGVASLGAVCAILFVLDVRVVRVDLVADPSIWIAAVAGAAASAAVIALKEEVLFRGGLFSAICRAGGATLALWAGAGVYAAAHFLEVPAAPDSEPLRSGFAVLGQALGAVARLQNLDSLLALLCAGVVLGVVRLRDGDIAACLGIHFGWVLTIKLFKKLTYISQATPMRALAGQYDDVIGWLAALVFAVLALALWRRPRTPRSHA